MCNHRRARQEVISGQLRLGKSYLSPAPLPGLCRHPRVSSSLSPSLARWGVASQWHSFPQSRAPVCVSDETTTCHSSIRGLKLKEGFCSRLWVRRMYGIWEMFLCGHTRTDVIESEGWVNHVGKLYIIQEDHLQKSRKVASKITIEHTKPV
jgi:hypothetical protein